MTCFWMEENGKRERIFYKFPKNTVSKVNTTILLQILKISLIGNILLDMVNTRTFLISMMMDIFASLKN